MGDPVTIDDIYNLFRETEKLFEKSEAERLKSKAEFDRSLAESKAEFDRRMAKSKAESDRSMEELRRIVKEGNRRINALSDRWGAFVERLVEPGLEKLFQQRGIDVKETHSRLRVRREHVAMEVDILVVDGDQAVVVEVKSRLSQDKVQEFLAKLPRFKEAFPAYQNYTIYGAIAGIEVEEQAARYAYKQGLFVIVQAGEMVQFANDDNFSPKSW